MRHLLRRIRGAIKMGLTWAVACASLGFIPRWVLGMQGDLPFPILFFGLGFIGGVTFSTLLVAIEGRKRFHEMSAPRFALWGAIGGGILSALFLRGTSPGLIELIAIPTLFAGASAACASGSLLLARRAEQLELPSSRDESAGRLTD